MIPVWVTRQCKDWYDFVYDKKDLSEEIYARNERGGIICTTHFEKLFPEHKLEIGDEPIALVFQAAPFVELKEDERDDETLDS